MYLSFRFSLIKFTVWHLILIKSPFFETLDLLDDVVDLTAVEICSVVITQEYMIQFLVIELTHHLTSHPLPLRSWPVLGILFEFTDHLLLFLEEGLILIIILLRRRINTIEPCWEVLRVIFVVIVERKVWLEANSSTTLLFHHDQLTSKAQRAFGVIFTLRFVG